MIAQVIPAKRGPLRLAILDYLIPPELEGQIAVGQLVTIPLRNREEFGVVCALLDQPTVTGQLKMLKSLVHQGPFLTIEQLNFLQEMAALYHTSLGFILTSNLLPLQKRKLKQLPEDPLPALPKNTRKASKPIVYTYTTPEEKKKYLSQSISVGQTLVLVPEVHEAAVIERQLTPEEREKAVVITSDLSVKDLFASWVAIWRREKTIIIGTRAALFLPFSQLETIIVVNEGNESHKSWDMAPRFHAREAALMLAKHHGAATHLISHVPSVETYFFAKHNVYDTAGELIPKNVSHYTVVNMRDERRGGNTSHLSLDALAAVDRPGTVFLFCNRRGTMSHVSCRDCGTVITCPRCGRSLTYYHEQSQLICHRCSIYQPMAENCPKCGGATIAFFGAGTAAIASQLKKMRPDETRPIIILDQDSGKKSLPDEDCIIVGTQFAWSLIPWERLRALVFVDADTLLYIPEYRLSERLWNSLHDARFLLPPDAECIVQTTHPEHPVFLYLYEPERWYIGELAERKLFGYPPYHYLLKIFLGHVSEAKSKMEIDRLYRGLIQLTDVAKTGTITKPFPLFPPLQKGQFWQAILIKLPYGKYKQQWRAIVALLPDSYKVDPNPLTIFGL